MTKSLVKLRKMPLLQLNKVDKDYIIGSILSSPGGGEIAMTAYTEKLNDVMQ